jgi:hypothetical protein
MRKTVALALVGLLTVTSLPTLFAAGPSRAEIRSQPILTRPYRFGHVYGNTVRRRAKRSAEVTLPSEFQRMNAIG